MTNTYIDEEIIHYIAHFLEHYDIGTKLHKDSCKDMRDLSNDLLENLERHMEIRIIRRRKIGEGTNQ